VRFIALNDILYRPMFNLHPFHKLGIEGLSGAFYDFGWRRIGNLLIFRCLSSNLQKAIF